MLAPVFDTRVTRFVSTHERRAAAAVFLLVAICYAGYALHIRGGAGLTGDEPHYLAITQGLLLYHTLDQHSVLYHHDFFSYYPYLMSSHAIHRNGQLFSIHYIGLPVVMLPGFALAGVKGASATLAAGLLLLSILVWRLCRRVAGPAAALATAAVVALSAPFVLNSGAIYPDGLSAAVLLGAFLAAVAGPLTLRRGVLLGVLLAFAPWLHVKLLLAVPAILLVVAIEVWRRRGSPGIKPELRALALAYVLPSLSIGGLSCFNAAVYGNASLTAEYAGSSFVFTDNPLAGLVGQLFSEGAGVLGVAPFFFLCVPGAVGLWRRDRWLAAEIAIVTVPYWLVTLTYRNWWGGDAPPLRFLLPVVAFWVAGVAVLLEDARATLTRCVIVLSVVWTLALSIAVPFAARHGFPVASGHSPLLDVLSGWARLPLAAWMPTFIPQNVGPGAWQQAWLVPVWATGLAILAGAIIKRERYKSPDS